MCAFGLMQDRRDQKAYNNERKRDRADPHTSKGKVVVGWIGCCAVHSVRATKKHELCRVAHVSLIINKHTAAGGKR